MCKDERWQVVVTTSIGDMEMIMKIPISKVVFSGLIMRIIDIGILIINQRLSTLPSHCDLDECENIPHCPCNQQRPLQVVQCRMTEFR